MIRYRVKEVYDDCIVDANGVKYYYKDNYIYKEIDKYGDIYYYNKSEQCHRLDGLHAVEWADGYKTYYKNSFLHRLDGPAYEGLSGYKEYWIDGKKYSYEDWSEKVKEYE